MTTSDKSLKRGNWRHTKHRSHRMHPNSLKALIPTQYPPGTNGNNGGNGYSLKAELKHALNKEKRLELVNSTIEGAILREPTPFKEVWDRVDGKVLGDQPTGTQDNRVLNFVFVLPDGTKVTPKALIEGNE